MSKRILYIIITLLAISISIFVISFTKKEEKQEVIKPADYTNENFDFKVINETNNKFKENFMISPLSIGYALSMLKEGATNNTKDEVDKLLGNYELPKTLNIKDRISLANLLFINEKNKNDISTDYINLLQNKYDSDLLFDPLLTPTKINEWISNKTFNMINDAIKQISPETVVGLANAIAIDVEWYNEFECASTTERDFTLVNKEKMKTPMMHSSNDAAYIESANAKGIIKDYKPYNIETGEVEYPYDYETGKTKDITGTSVQLEYIAILPNRNIDDYLKGFNKKELDTLLSSKQYSNDKLDINYSIPKYEYDFDYKGFINSLKSLGIKDAFDPVNASFEKMVKSDSKLHLYVNDALHKSHIELNEKGTKAAAVTVIMFKDNAMLIEEKKKEINITFDKPFIYIIKEKNSSNIWFYGVVYKPMDFKDNPKCEFE